MKLTVEATAAALCTTLALSNMLSVSVHAEPLGHVGEHQRWRTDKNPYLRFYGSWRVTVDDDEGGGFEAFLTVQDPSSLRKDDPRDVEPIQRPPHAACGGIVGFPYDLTPGRRVYEVARAEFDVDGNGVNGQLFHDVVSKFVDDSYEFSFSLALTRGGVMEGKWRETRLTDVPVEHFDHVRTHGPGDYKHSPLKWATGRMVWERVTAEIAEVDVNTVNGNRTLDIRGRNLPVLCTPGMGFWLPPFVQAKMMPFNYYVYSDEPGLNFVKVLAQMDPAVSRTGRSIRLRIGLSPVNTGSTQAVTPDKTVFVDGQGVTFELGP